MQDGVCARCCRYVAPTVNKTAPCLHQHVTVYWRLYAAATLYDPAEYEGKGQCEDCGEWMDPEDVDEEAEREDVTS